MNLYPQVLVNVRVRQAFDFAQSRAVRGAVAAAEKALKGDGRVLLRASGTEPLIRIMVEGRSRKLVTRLAGSIAKAVEGAVRA